MTSINDCQLTTEDGTRIAYRVQGKGPALVLTNGLTTTTTFWKHLLPIWLERHTVITWDLPGHGRSGPALTPYSATVQAQPRFVADVMQAAGVERAFQIGWSTGSQIVLETYRQLPERCEGLVMLLGPAGRVLQTTRLPLGGDLIHQLLRSTPPGAFAGIFHVLARGMSAPGSHTLGRLLGLIGKNASAQDVQQMLQHIGTVDATTLQRMVCSAETHNARDVLPTLAVPLLIVAGDKDPFAPSELVGVPLHNLAPFSELLRLPEGTHTAMLEQPTLIAEAVERFITAAQWPARNAGAAASTTARNES
jgi:pimeloyl-ACP methyl ester carboxylesterase